MRRGQVGVQRMGRRIGRLRGRREMGLVGTVVGEVEGERAWSQKAHGAKGRRRGPSVLMAGGEEGAAGTELGPVCGGGEWVDFMLG